MGLTEILIRGVVLTDVLIRNLMMRNTLPIHASLDFGLATLGLIGLLYLTNLRKRAGFWLGVFGLGATSFVFRSKIAGGLLSLLFLKKFWKTFLILIISLLLIYQGVGDLALMSIGLR